MAREHILVQFFEKCIETASLKNVYFAFGYLMF